MMNNKKKDITFEGKDDRSGKDGRVPRNPWLLAMSLFDWILPGKTFRF